MNFLNSDKNRNFIYLFSIYLIIYFLFTQFNINENYIKNFNLEKIYNFNLYLEVINNNNEIKTNYTLVDFFFYYLIYLFAPFKTAFEFNSISISLIVINTTTLLLLFISISKLLEKIILITNKIDEDKIKGFIFFITTAFSFVIVSFLYLFYFQNLYISNILLNSSLLLFIVYYSLLLWKEEYLEIDYIVLITILCSLLSLNLL